MSGRVEIEGAELRWTRLPSGSLQATCGSFIVVVQRKSGLYSWALYYFDYESELLTRGFGAPDEAQTCLKAEAFVRDEIKAMLADMPSATTDKEPTDER